MNIAGHPGCWATGCSSVGLVAAAAIGNVGADVGHHTFYPPRTVAVGSAVLFPGLGHPRCGTSRQGCVVLSIPADAADEKLLYQRWPDHQTCSRLQATGCPHPLTCCRRLSQSVASGKKCCRYSSADSQRNVRHCLHQPCPEPSLLLGDFLGLDGRNKRQMWLFLVSRFSLGKLCEGLTMLGPLVFFFNHPSMTDALMDDTLRGATYNLFHRVNVAPSHLRKLILQLRLQLVSLFFGVRVSPHQRLDNRSRYRWKDVPGQLAVCSDSTLGNPFQNFADRTHSLQRRCQLVTI